MNHKGINREIDSLEFVEEQLFEAKQALFMARSVREIKFLQNKISYLRQKMKNMINYDNSKRK